MLHNSSIIFNPRASRSLLIHSLPLHAAQVIIFDPCYDSYAPMARMAGAVMHPIPLSLPDFHVPREELAAAFNDKTKVLLINSPHNPVRHKEGGREG